MVKVTETQAAGHPTARAPRGAAISCKGWQQEASLRMLMNSLDPEVADAREDGISCGGGVRAARDSKSFQAIVESLERLESDETLLIEAGEPAGILRSNSDAPRLLIVDSNAASWIYVGTQAHLQGAYEAMAAAAREYFQGALGGKLVVSGGMGARGGAFALGAMLHGAAFLGIDADPERIKRRVKSGYCDVMVNDLDEALRILKNAVRKREAGSVGLAANQAMAFQELAQRGVVPDLLVGCTVHAESVAALGKMGARRLDSTAAQGDGRHPFLCAALSGESADIYRADRLLLEMFPRDEMLPRWLPAVQKRVRFEGLPARVVWLGHGARRAFALALNDLAARGEWKAPLALGHGEVGELPDCLDAVADGTKEMAERMERAVGGDPGSAIVRSDKRAEIVGAKTPFRDTN